MLGCGTRKDFRLGLLVLGLRPFLLWHLVRIRHLQSILCVQVVALLRFVGLGTCSCLHIIHLGVLLSIFRLLLLVFQRGWLVRLLSLPFGMSMETSVHLCLALYCFCGEEGECSGKEKERRGDLKEMRKGRKWESKTECVIFYYQRGLSLLTLQLTSRYHTISFWLSRGKMKTMEKVPS